MKRKLLALLLALVMVLSLLPAALVPDTAVADGNNGVLALETVQGGAILHCFDWSYNEIKAALPDIKAAGYVAVQTSPVQQPKDYNAEWTDGNQWWKLYQPLGFTIADGDTWLGTKAELTELCTVAEKQYGIKVIVDVVANHLANKTGGGGWEQVNENIDPDLYYPEYFHTNTAGVNDTNRYTMTQNQMGMPDLNTSNQFVQQKVYDFLVECVDCGVDGFRFDAAKHIELPGDADCGSDFWPAILNGGDDKGEIYGIRPYAASKGLNVFIYGESLSGTGYHEGYENWDTWVDEYISYMALTDSDYGGRIRSAIGGTNAGMLGDGRYVRCEDARGNVVWVESHDTYEDGGSVWLTDDQIIKAWAIVGARADSTALFFARPNDTMGLASTDNTWKSTAVAEVNKFKTRYDGMSEYMHSDYSSKVAWVERGGNGVVISKLDGAGSVYLNVCQMSDGNYKDQITGSTFTVANGMISGTVGSSGVAVVYKAEELAVNATPTQSSYIRTTPLYLIPNDNWKKDGARFAMYVNNSDTNAWVSMTEVADGVFEAELPVGDWTNVIFLRMNPAFDENRWNRPEDGDNKPVWNQTADLGHAFTGNCYTINEESWSDGAWGIYNPYAGYYLVGNMNGWAVNQNYRLVFNPNASANEYSINVKLNQFSSFKIVYSADGEKRTTWYPEGEGTDYSDITAAGTYDIYFRPDKDGGNDWYKNCIYVDEAHAQTSTNDNAGFYLVGTMTNWKVESGYKLTEGTDGVYSIDKHLSVMDQFKVVYSADGAETSIWYPDPSPNYGADDATRIIGSGVYHISFRPNYDGGEGWFNNCIKVSGCPVTVNIVGNSDLITWSLYKSEGGDMDLWQHGEEERPEAAEMIKLEDGDNVVPVGWYVGLEATTKNGINADFYCETTYTNNNGQSTGTSGGSFVGSRYRMSVGPLGEGPVIITITLTVNAKPTFTTRSLTLGGEIGVNFYMDLSMLSDAEKASSYMTFEVGTENKKVVSQADYDATKTGENGTYGFTCYVNAIEMADDIKPVFHYKLSGDSEEKTVVRSAYSVRLYVVESLNPETLPQPDATTAALEKKLIEYGHYVQLYLQKLRGWAFGTDYTKIEPYGDVAQDYSNKYDAIKAELAGHAITRTINDNSVIEKITYSLVLDSETTIRVYIKPAAGYDGEITVDGAATIATKLNDGRYLVEIKGIGAHELGETYTININNGAASVQVSAMSYVYGMLTYDNASPEAKDAVCSIYYYWKAALNYLSAH